MYYRIEFRTHSMFVYSAIAKIVNRSNVVKRRTSFTYELAINTKKDYLIDELTKALESKGYTTADYKLTSTPYERKAPKKRKSKK